MAILSEIFATASDDEATSFLESGARADDRIDAVIETTGLTSVEIDVLHAQLIGSDTRTVLRSDGGGMVANAGEQGPWVERIRPELAGLLAAMTAEQVPPAAAAWVADADLDGVDAADAAALLTELTGLARLASERGHRLYVWTAI